MSSKGKRVGIVTNDQAHDLVDTNSLPRPGARRRGSSRARASAAGSTTSSARVGSLQDAERPDVILAEPVGSCTDLVATVVQPLKDLYGGRFEVAPYAVLFKPSHGLRILKNQPAGGFSPKAAYIFKKQLEEADAILINRIDESTRRRLDELTRLLAEQFPGTPVLRVSAKTGQGFDALTDLLDQTGGVRPQDPRHRLRHLRRGRSGTGLAERDRPAHVRTKPFDLDALLTAILSRARQRVPQPGRRSGTPQTHRHGRCRRVRGGERGEQRHRARNCRCRRTEAEGSRDLIVNARVAMDPAVLEAEVKKVVTAECGKVGVKAEFRNSQSLRPGRPVPTHRYAEAKK